MKEKILNFITKNKYPAFILLLILLIVISSVISLIFSNKGVQEVSEGIEQIPSIDNSDKVVVDSIKEDLENKANYSDVSIQASFTEVEINNVKDNLLVFSYSNIPLSEIRNIFGFSSIKNISPEYARGAGVNVSGFLNAYINLLNNSTDSNLVNFSFEKIINKDIVLHSGTNDVSEAPLYASSEATHTQEAYRLLLNNNYLLTPHGYLEVVTYVSHNTNGGDSFVDFPIFLPESLTIIGKSEFNYNNVVLKPLVYKDPSFIDFVVNNSGFNVSEDSFSIIPDSGSVVYVLDFEKNHIIPLLSKEATLEGEAFESLEKNRYILSSY